MKWASYFCFFLSKISLVLLQGVCGLVMRNALEAKFVEIFEEDSVDGHISLQRY